MAKLYFRSPKFKLWNEILMVKIVDKDSSVSSGADASRSDTSAQELAALRNAISRLKDQHALELRQIEIASSKAELAMAHQLKQVGLQANAPTKGHASSHEQRGLLEKLLFRKNGRPCKPLRLLLFSNTGLPRSFAKRIVFHKNGAPRRCYLQWMKSSEYQQLPRAHQI